MRKETEKRLREIIRKAIRKVISEDFADPNTLGTTGANLTPVKGLLDPGNSFVTGSDLPIPNMKTAKDTLNKECFVCHKMRGK